MESTTSTNPSKDNSKLQTIYSYQVKTISGETQSLENYKNQVLLIVNTASKCGFTPQYKGLEDLQQKYKDQGFNVLAFPCNQFGAQEPGDENEIKNFCQLNYQTSFPLFAKIDVNGESAHPLFQFLKKAQTGLLGTEMIKWNFTKFLINRRGEPVARFAPTDKPESLEGEISKLLSI